MANLINHRRPHRTGWKHAAIANAAAGIYHQQSLVKHQPRALKTVIHDDEINALAQQQIGTFHPVGRNHRRRLGGEQHWFVTNEPGRIFRQINDRCVMDAAAIAAGQKPWFQTPVNRSIGERQCRRRLAGTADGEITDAYDRNGHGLANPAVHDAARNAPVDPSEGREYRGLYAGRLPPERRGFAHHCPPPRLSEFSLSRGRSRALTVNGLM